MDDDDVEVHVRIVDDTATGGAKVRASVRRLSNDVEREASTGGDRAGRSFASRFAAGLQSDRSKSRGAGLLGGIRSTLQAGLEPTAKTLATAFSASFVAQVAAGLASGAGKMLHGFGAVAALLPAIAVTAGVALGVVKVALMGVGDALKAGLSGDAEKFNESLKDMAPSAQTFARGLVALRPLLNDVKQVIQGRFFAPFAESIRPLGEKYLPMVDGRLGDIAGSFGQMGRQLASWLMLPRTGVQIAGVLDNVGLTVDNLTSGFGGLLRAFMPLITVGASFLPGLSHGFSDLTDDLARFMEEAERTGKLRQFISDGLSKIGDLVTTGKQLWRIFQNIGAIAKQAFSHISTPAGGLLTTFEQLTAKARAFFETPEGAEVMARIMEGIKLFAESAMGTLQKLAELIAPFLPQIAEFITAFNNLKTAIIEAIAPAIAIILGGLLPALTAVLEWLTNNGPVLQSILISIFTLWALHAGIAAAATIAATWPLILLGAAIAAVALVIITQWDRIKGAFEAGKEWVGDRLRQIGDFLAGLARAISATSGTMWLPIATALQVVLGSVERMIEGLKAAYYSLPFIDEPSGPGRRIGRSSAAAAAAPPRSATRATLRASGGVTGGLTRMAEWGREILTEPSGRGVLVNAPPGSRVHSNADTNRMLAGAAGGQVVRLEIAAAPGDEVARFLADMLRRYVHVTAGGNVQMAIGYNR